MVNRKNINSIKEDISIIKKELKEKCSDMKYQSLISDLKTLYALCDDLNISISDDEASRLSIEINKNVNKIFQNIQKEYENNSEYYLKLATSISKLGQKYIFLNDEEYEINLKDKITGKESYELVSDFLNTYNRNIYDILYNSGNKLIISKDIEPGYGYAYGFDNFKRKYILVGSSADLLLSNTIIHESGHLYTDFKNYDNSLEVKEFYNLYCYFVEVYPFFLELLYNKFLSDNNVHTVDSKKILKNSFAEMLGAIRSFKFYLETDSLLLYNLLEYKTSCEYSFGRVLSYHFYDMYLKDPEKTNYNIENFIFNMAKMDTVTVLNSFGFNQDELLSTKVLEKHIDKLLII